MRKSSILFLLFTLLVFSSVGQENSVCGIFIRATTSVSGGEYFINILERGHSFQIIYQFKDSTSKKVNEDASVISVRNSLAAVEDLRPDNDTVKKLVLTLDSLYQTYTSYSRDSLSITYEEKPSYVVLFQKVLASSVEELENNNRNRIVLDGTRMKFIISNKGETKTVYVNSPSIETNPVLYSLLRETLNLYRQRKGNILLTEQRTSGY
ncbi:MAG TPA: hypothetical protein VGN63_06485 [Flavisolibacter sp.]|jgi:hypothetical protein|nr:hypothetical protein [Flavisolibacter sp.]